MSVENAGPPAAEAPWNRIHFVPPGGWVADEAYDAGVAAKDGAHLTYLLISRQTNAETAQSFHATAVRMETPMAVQNQSQWKMVFNPHYQEFTLHWLRVVRAGVRIDHLKRDRMRLFQRETQLEQHVLDGGWTLLVVFDDVRPGDIIEAGYSFTGGHPISAGKCEVFFALPPAAVIGRYRNRVIFDPSRPMASKASPEIAPLEQRITPEGLSEWKWEGSQSDLRVPEANVPGGTLDYTWIQVSDFGDWNALARRAAEAWDRVPLTGDFLSWPAFARPASPVPDDIATLVQYIQDEFRYFSVDLATGGWIPSAPQEVAQRRYGDCKDLALLAVAVLRPWGVTARPILVGSAMRGSIATFLPMVGLFNHAVLEVEISGKRRWFDLTMRNQGGDFDTQPVARFGQGLPIAAEAGLTAQPDSAAANAVALRETYYLDTWKGEASAVEQRIFYDGWQAENVRRARYSKGPQNFAEERLKLAQKRFGNAKRQGELQWRDDRKKNTCEVVDVFNFSTGMPPASRSKRVNYVVPGNPVWDLLPVPPDLPRRGAWALPYPFECRYAVIVRGRSMGPGGRYRQKWTTPALTVALEENLRKGEWSKTTQAVVEGASVPPGKISEFRGSFLDFRKRSSWQLFLPVGRISLTPHGSLGGLPAAGAGLDDYVRVSPAAEFPEAEIGQPLKRHWRERLRPYLPVWFRRHPRIVWAIFVGVILILAQCQHTASP